MDRMAYFNGSIVPESEVRVPFRDYGFQMGDGAFDSARSVAHKPFLFKEHVDRLYKSLGYLRLDPGLSPKEMLVLTHEIFEKNRPLLAEHDDYWVSQWVSRGMRSMNRIAAEGAPTVIVECSPLPFRGRAQSMRDGLDVMTPAGIRRTPPEAISPRYKSMSYGNLVAGDIEVQAMRPGATCILLDTRGCLCEGLGSNIFIVRDGEVLTPHERYVLAGLSRQTLMGIAADKQIPLREADIDLYDAYVADEAFITSTSWCLVPVKSINGKPLAAGAWGPVTRRLSEGYKERLGGFDYVAQYTRHN
ncbi:MAG TPA: aminotransferase class IV [Aestuariivirgaceae bacterium]|nr:aminotransferase class IV [Aestuariivirgaceae bacterium]